MARRKSKTKVAARVKASTQPNLNSLYILIGFIVLVLAGVFVYVQKLNFQKTAEVQPSKQKQQVSSQIISAKFSCDDGKTVEATFINNSSGGSVELSLSDGRHVDLPSTVSADGARYANWDESFVFWNRGNTAFIQENNSTTFNNCVAQK